MKCIYILVVVIHLCLVSTSAQSYHDEIPLSRGSQYIWAWQAEISLCCLGVIYNSLTLSMMLSLDESNKMSFYTLNLAINILDFLFNLGRITFASTYLRYGQHSGGSTSCELESLWNFTLVIWSAVAIVGISLVARHDLCNGQKYTERQMVVYMMRGLVYSLAVAFCCIYLPYAGYQITSAATYCFLSASSKLAAPVFFTFGIFSPLAYLAYNLRLIRLSILRAQEQLKLHGIKEIAKGSYIKMVLKMGFFLVACLTFYSPVLFITIYQWCVQAYAPPELSIAAGLSAICLSSFVNPSLFFYLNSDLRIVFWNKYGLLIIKFLYKTGLTKLYLKFTGKKLFSRKFILKTKQNNIQSMRKVQTVQVVSAKKIAPVSKNSVSSYSSQPHIASHAHRSSNSNTESLFFDPITGIEYDCMMIWLDDHFLMKSFTEFGRQEYAIENFLFYSEAKSFTTKAILYKARIEELLEIREKYKKRTDNRNAKVPEFVINDWKELEVLGWRLYTLFIQTPDAPLEINIPSKMREAIGAKLQCYRNKASQFQSSKLDVNIDDASKEYYYILHAYDDDDDEKIVSLIDDYIHVYDESLKTIVEILKTNAWPRFIKSSLCESAIIEHREQKKKYATEQVQDIV